MQIENSEILSDPFTSTSPLKKKKLRKLVKQQSSDEVDDIFFGDEQSDENNNLDIANSTRLLQKLKGMDEDLSNQIVDVFDEDDDQTIKQNAKKPVVTYKSKLDELAAQIEEMDAEMQGELHQFEEPKKLLKRVRKSNKKLVSNSNNPRNSSSSIASNNNNSNGENNDIFGDFENQEANPEIPLKKSAKAPRVSKGAFKTESANIERNEDLLRRLADKFDVEEADEDDQVGAVYYNGDDDDEDYEGDDAAGAKKTAGKTNSMKNVKTGSQQSKAANANNKKMKNKLFNTSEISIAGSTENVLSSEFQPIEEECVQEESITFEQRQNARNSKNLFGFLHQSVLYKKQRGLDFDASQLKLKEQVAQSQESVSETSLAAPLTLLAAGAGATGTGDESEEQINSQKVISFSQLELSSQNSGVVPIDAKKLQLLKKNSMQMQRLSSDSQASMKNIPSDLGQSNMSASQANGAFAMANSDSLKVIDSIGTHDDLDIELEVPTVDRSLQKQDSVINNTLFFNKMMRTDSSVLSSLTRQTSTSNSSVLSNSNAAPQASRLSNSNPQMKKVVSRQAYLSEGQRRITERKSQSLNFQEVHNRFKHTTLENVIGKNEKKAASAEDSKGATTASATTMTSSQKSTNDKKTTSQELESTSSIQEGDLEALKNSSKIIRAEQGEEEVEEDGDDGDYNPKEGSEQLNEDEDEEDEEEKQEQLIQAEIQYRKLLALEEGMSEKEIERMIREEYGLGEASDEGEEEEEEAENDENNEEEASGEGRQQQQQEDMKKSNSGIESSIYGDFEDATEVKHIDENENDEDLKPLKRLKKIAGEILQQRKAKDDARKMKEERRARRKALLANPLMKRIMGDMIENEAEQGSDNEENDDKVHANLNEEAEHRQAGLDREEDLDAELAELINNQVTLNDEDEQIAASKFLRDLARQDKEELKKIISGAYKSTRAKKRNLSDLLQDNMDGDEDDENAAAGQQAKKLKRIQDAILMLQQSTEDGQYASDAEEDNHNNIDGGLIRKKSGQQQKRRSKKGETSANDEENELIMIREANLLLKKEYQKVSGLQAFDEKKLVDTSLIALLGNARNSAKSQQSSSSTVNGQTNQLVGLKRIIPLRISSSSGSSGNDAAAADSAVGITGNANGTGISVAGTAAAATTTTNAVSSVFGGLKQLGANAKNSVLHVKQNKHRLSQFNESFNKDSMINEFGESALQKAFTNYADHSQSIFYNQENSLQANNSNGFKEKKGVVKSAGTTGTATNKAIPQSQMSSLNKLFQSNSVIASSPAANQFMIFGRKKN